MAAHGTPASVPYIASRRMVPEEAIPILENAEKAIAKGKFKKADKLLKESEGIMTQKAKEGVALSSMNKIPETGVRRLDPWRDSPGVFGGRKTRRRKYSRRRRNKSRR